MGLIRPRSVRAGQHEKARPTSPLAPATDQLLFEQSRDMILIVRLADGRILDANRAAEQAFGYSHAEFLARSIFDLRVPELRSDIGSQLPPGQ